jgi:hypothetical protein
MTTHLRVIATAAVLVGVVAAPSARQPGDGERLIPHFDRLEAAMLETGTVDKLLTGREQLVALMRNDVRAARAWQINQLLLKEMKDEEIVDYVIRRANMSLTCRLAVMGHWDLSKPVEGSDYEKTVGQSVGRLWEGARKIDGAELDDDCTTFIDADDQPFTLTTRAHLQGFQSLVGRFRQPRTPLSADPTIAPLLQANVKYLREQFGAPPFRESRVERLLGSAPPPIFSRQVLTFKAYLQAVGDDSRLVLLVPLSM